MGPPSDWTPLHRAVWSHNYDQVRSLVRSGDINRTDDQGWTPLHLACAAEGELLFDSHQLSSRGYSQFTFSGSSSKRYSKFEWGPGRHSSFTLSDNEERSQSFGILETLLQNGADVHAIAKGFCTPLHCAANSGWLSHAMALVKAGAEVYTGPECSPLCWVKDGSGSNHPVALFLREELGERGLTMIEQDHERLAAGNEERSRGKSQLEPPSLTKSKPAARPVIGQSPALDSPEGSLWSRGLLGPLLKKFLPTPEQPLPKKFLPTPEQPLPKKVLPRPERPLFKKQTHTRINDDGLCSVCSEITLESLVSQRGYIHLSSLELVQQSATGCKLCQIIVSALPKSQKLPQGARSQILINASDGSYSKATNDTLRVLEFKVSQGCMCNLQQNPEPSPDYTSCRGNCSIFETASITMFTDQDNPLGEFKIQSGKSVEVDPISESTARTMKAWLSECDRYHCSECAGPDTSNRRTDLPMRFVDVGESGEQRIRIADNRKLFAKYVALSHRWVTGPMPAWVTKEDNLEARRSWFAPTDLSPSIVDAVKVTRRLGIRYIWIDSLCIIQDSAQDWNIEAAKMASVYASAYVTIFADSGKDDEHGFLSLRQVFPVVPITIKIAIGVPLTIKLRKSASNSYKSIERELFRSDCEESSYLSKRAWILQERVLSRRIMHFGEHQMYWECKKSAVAEDGHAVSDWDRKWLIHIHKLLNAENPSELESYNNWAKLIEVYSTHKLTYGEDKVPALSGLASVFYEKIQDGWVAGHWKSTLHASLAWSSKPKDPDDLPLRPTKYRAPSFSWACVDCEINIKELEDLQQDEKNKELNLTFISNNTHLEGIDPFGKISGCSILVSGLFRRAINMGPYKTSLGDTDKGYNPLYNLNMTPIGSMRNDAKDDIGIENVFCLRLFGPSHRCYFLVLVPTVMDDEECTTFRRIGLGDTLQWGRSNYRDGKFFDGAERKTITLV